ncbi:hypothetical protein TWF481_009135 [Arthrobotrys musiformis]|uniref:Uncharacterized protein n=1 Tax=Arthrobotrys musiformis TaxID=47236 RepID=A0AAV9W455_9PEZI
MVTQKPPADKRNLTCDNSSSQRIPQTNKPPNIHGTPPPQKLRLVSERPENVPRYYITSYQIQQWLQNDYGIGKICFYHIVEALETALEGAPCPATFNLKPEHLARLEIKWCQQISHVLRNSLDPAVLEYLEQKFTNEFGYYLFCLAQNCSDSMPQKPSKSTDCADGKCGNSASLEDYVILNKDGTHKYVGRPQPRRVTPSGRTTVTSPGGKSRAFFDLSAIRGKSPVRKLENDKVVSKKASENDRAGKEASKTRNRAKYQRRERSRLGLTESQGWILMGILIGLLIGYWCGFPAK